MTVDDNKAVVRRFFEKALNQRNYGLFDELVAPEFILHSALMGEIRGGEPYKQSSLALLGTSQDFHATIEDIVGAEGDTVIARLSYRGTDTGGFVKDMLQQASPLSSRRSTSGACATASRWSCGTRRIAPV